MLGRLSSLNVATAAGLAAYEVARRRRLAATEGV
jgi:tRNA G18 (ribose-2'-O)-methylase SpoU